MRSSVYYSFTIQTDNQMVTSNFAGVALSYFYMIQTDRQTVFPCSTFSDFYIHTVMTGEQCGPWDFYLPTVMTDVVIVLLVWYDLMIYLY